MKNKYKILIVILILLIFSVFTLYAYEFNNKNNILKKSDNQKFIIGNMNGVALKVPVEYQEWKTQYSGEDRWKISGKSLERTFDSGIDTLELAAKWPSMEHKYQGNNYKGYVTRGKIGGSKDWLSITVWSYFSSLSPKEIDEQIKYKNQNISTGIIGILHAQLNGKFLHLPQGNHFELRGFDEKLKLNWASVSGPNSSDPALGNVNIYWDGNANHKIFTLIECSGPKAKNLEELKRCKQRFDLPKLNAQVIVYYKSIHLHEWKDIQANTRNMALSFIN